MQTPETFQASAARQRGPRRPRTLALLAGAVLALHLLGLQSLPLGGAVAATSPAGSAAGSLLFSVKREPESAAVPEATMPLPSSRPAARRAPAPVDIPADHTAVAAMPSQALPPAAPAKVAPAALVAAAEAPATTPAQAGAKGDAATPQAVRVPPPMRLHYKLQGQAKGFPLAGQAEIQWKHDGQHYEARLEMGGFPFTKRWQQSYGRITPQGLAPERFADKVRSEEVAHFDAAAGRIRFSGNQPDAPLQPGAQDRLSVLLQVGALIAGDPKAYPKGRQVTMQTATVRDAEVWHFSVEGEEELQLPAGHQRTLRLLRLPRREFDQKVELWLAPALDYVPVRVRLTQPDGDWLEQLWSGTDRN